MAVKLVSRLVAHWAGLWESSLVDSKEELEAVSLVGLLAVTMASTELQSEFLKVGWRA